MTSVCFVVANAFQAGHIAALARRVGGTLIARPKLAKTLTVDAKVLPWRRTWTALDGVYDVIVGQTAFAGAGAMRKSRVVFVQYGYAKEPHNFGGWRGFADLNIAYGPYAAAKMAHFAPALPLGHPRQQEVLSDGFTQAARDRYGPSLNPDLPTVLYAPTWGPLSSFERYGDALLALSDRYNLLFKLHHLTAEREKDRVAKLRDEGVQFFGAGDDFFALAVLADAVISDYSGAIFDAGLLGKPVVLFDLPDAVGTAKMDPDSLEITRRADLGQVVADPADVAAGLQAALSEPLADSTLIQSLYADEPDPLDAMAKAIAAVAAGEIEPTQMQRYAMTFVRGQEARIVRIKRRSLAALGVGIALFIALLLI